MQNPALIQVDIKNWPRVPQPAPAIYPHILSVSKDGFVNLGERLKKEMEEHSPNLVFGFYLEPGGRTLALQAAEEGDYRFPKGGRIKDCEFSRQLVEFGVALPARYHVAWNESAEAWVGCLATEAYDTKAKALKKSLSTATRRKGGASR